jgi:hypothetical protein
MADAPTLTGEVVPPEQEALDAAKTQFGDARAVKTMAGWIVLRQPKKAEHDRWFAMERDAREKYKAPEYIVRALRVWPSPDAFDAMIDRKPGLCTDCMGAVNELMGISGEAEVKS